MSDDLIRRSDAKQAIYELLLYLGEEDINTVVETVMKDIPSADRPRGEWLKFGLGRGTRILFCTNCERRIEVPLSQGNSNYDFCLNCGAKMKGAGDGNK